MAASLGHRLPRVVDHDHRQRQPGGQPAPAGSVSTAAAPRSAACGGELGAVVVRARQGDVQVAGTDQPGVEGDAADQSGPATAGPGRPSRSAERDPRPERRRPGSCSHARDVSEYPTRNGRRLPGHSPLGGQRLVRLGIRRHGVARQRHVHHVLVRPARRCSFRYRPARGLVTTT